MAGSKVRARMGALRDMARACRSEGGTRVADAFLVLGDGELRDGRNRLVQLVPGRERGEYVVDVDDGEGAEVGES